jgi:ComF family protein
VPAGERVGVWRGAKHVARRAAGWLLDVLYPEDCRICCSSLRELARYPVCSRCLLDVEPFHAEHACIQCQTPFVNRHPLDENGRCSSCRLGVRGYDQAWSYGAYDGPLRRLIHLLKYERIPTLARPLANLLARALPRDCEFDSIVPVPMHWRRRWSRGFNQSALLARELSRRSGIPVNDALARTHRSAQAGLSSAARRRNVSGSFLLAAGANVAGQRVLLIDDVLTTGSTAASCARVLKRAGAASVSLLTVARADRRFGRGLLAGLPAQSDTEARGMSL